MSVAAASQERPVIGTAFVTRVTRTLLGCLIVADELDFRCNRKVGVPKKAK